MKSFSGINCLSLTYAVAFKTSATSTFDDCILFFADISIKLFSPAVRFSVLTYNH